MNLFFCHKSIYKLLLLYFMGFLVFSCNPKDKKPPLFELLDSKFTNIDFENTLISTDSLNILNFEYMFNGGGVGIGDINNDGLQDLYFTGNQVSSKLYLNLGGFKFKDITNLAHVATTGWTNGVSMTDINQDGLLDIYVCKGGARNISEKDMANLVFINQGNNTFKEMGKELGIADVGYSIQAIFFDYDKDGHQDLYLLTNALVPFNRNASKSKMIKGEAASTDRLYKNNGDGTFSNVSKQAGIIIEGFGLGVAICDINDDGWLDVYVSNDFLTNDILYVNNCDGTFSDKISDYVKHQSFNGMGVEISDVNNDGLSDILVLDMLPQDNKRLKQTVGYFSYDKQKLNMDFGYIPQYVRNTLQLNNGNGTFSEIGQLSGIYNTDWSWAPLIADFDNDGWKDIFITNGYRRDVTNLDFIVYGQKAASFGTKEGIRKDKLEKLSALPEVKLHNYIFKNNGNLTFTDKVIDWGISIPSYSNGAAYADMDNDGDLDLVVNNIDDKAHVYKNNATEFGNSPADKNHFLRVKLKGIQNKIGTKVFLSIQGRKQYQFFSPVRGYLSTTEDIMHFGLGINKKIDALNVIWPDGASETIKNIDADQLLVLDYKNASNRNEPIENKSLPFFTDITSELGIEYTHKENNFIDFNEQATLLHMNSRLGPGIAVGDVNGDKLEDFYIGAANGKNGSFFMQQPNGSFREKELKMGEAYEDMGALLLDVDSDYDLDLILISGGDNPKKGINNYVDRIYENDGKGNFIKKDLLKRSESGSCVKAADFDKDGDLDMFIGGRSIQGSYPLSPKSYLLINEKGHFRDATKEVFGNEGKLGMVSDAIWTDFDNDQWVDLILVGEFMAPKFLKNNKGKLLDVSNKTGLKHSSGWWNSIASGDFDKDGDMDYLMGNLGQNSMLKASAQEPITIYAKDFDNNGSVDPVITCYRQGEEQLIHSREVLSQQINAMKIRFKTYESYATATFDKVFLKEELADVYTLKAEMLSSSYVENLGNGNFKMRTLPIEAQFAPVFGMEVQDYNNDGYLDAMLVGNFYSIEALTGQYDAMAGLCLLGNGKGEFKAMKPVKSGLRIDGDAKGLVQLQGPKGIPIILASQNSGQLLAYTYKTKKQSISVGPNDSFALIYGKDGSFYKKEFAYGSSYLSHSSRQFSIDRAHTNYIELYSFKGKIRKIDFSDEN